MSLGSSSDEGVRLSIGDAMDRLVRGGLPLRFTAYDGSSAGPSDAPIGMHLRTERGVILPALATLDIKVEVGVEEGA